MATRILVQCHSQDIPGEPNERRTIMANIICQHKWHRAFDKGQDRLQSLGQFCYDQNRVYILLDNGPPNSQDVSTSIYKWNGEQLIETPLNPVFRGFLQKYPFNAERKTSGYTDEEFKATFGEEKYEAMVLERIRQRRKWGQELLSHEKAFLQDHPELASQL
ncbi:hypothetical protein MKZ38_005068 [Zalerion maritima]|uniref:Uncharacterized protein n=1 Tax=Zalerion maritima TaxID=339359 RepID=A0AAD5RKN9_9PEZI|nr:hypothetical protein MKZ38_005068 [Zalerion maritima]